MHGASDMSPSDTSNIAANKTLPKISNIKAGPAPNLYPTGMTQNVESASIFSGQTLTSEVPFHALRVPHNTGHSYNIFNNTPNNDSSKAQNHVIITVNDNDTKLWGLRGYQESINNQNQFNSAHQGRENVTHHMNKVNSSSKQPTRTALPAQYIFSNPGSKEFSEVTIKSPDYGGIRKPNDMVVNKHIRNVTGIDNREHNAEFGYILHDEKSHGQTLLLLSEPGTHILPNVNPLAPFLQNYNSELNEYNLKNGVLSYNSLVDGEVPINERARALFGKTSDKNKIFVQHPNNKRLVLPKDFETQENPAVQPDTFYTHTQQNGEIPNIHNTRHVGTENVFSRNNYNVPNNNHRNNHQQPDRLASNSPNINFPNSEYNQKYESNQHIGNLYRGDFLTPTPSPPSQILVNHQPPFLSLDLRPPAPTQFYKPPFRSTRRPHGRGLNRNSLHSTQHQISSRPMPSSVVPQIFADQLASLSMEEPHIVANRKPEFHNAGSTTVNGKSPPEQASHSLVPISRTRIRDFKSQVQKTPATTEAPAYSWSYFFGSRSSEVAKEDETASVNQNGSKDDVDHQFYVSTNYDINNDPQNHSKDKLVRQDPNVNTPWNVHFQSQRYHQNQQLINKQSTQSYNENQPTDIDHHVSMHSQLQHEPFRKESEHEMPIHSSHQLKEAKSLSGFLSASEQTGTAKDLQPSNDPVLPGRNRNRNNRNSDSHSRRRSPNTNRRFRPRILSSSSFRRLPINHKHSINIKHFPPNFPFHQLNPFTALPTRLIAPPLPADKDLKNIEKRTSINGVRITESLEKIKSIDLQSLYEGTISLNVKNDEKNKHDLSHNRSSELIKSTIKDSTSNTKSPDENEFFALNVSETQVNIKVVKLDDAINNTKYESSNDTTSLHEQALNLQKYQLDNSQSQELKFKELSQPLLDALQQHQHLHRTDLAMLLRLQNNTAKDHESHYSILRSQNDFALSPTAHQPSPYRSSYTGYHEEVSDSVLTISSPKNGRAIGSLIQQYTPSGSSYNYFPINTPHSNIVKSLPARAYNRSPYTNPILNYQTYITSPASSSSDQSSSSSYLSYQDSKGVVNIDPQSLRRTQYYKYNGGIKTGYSISAASKLNTGKVLDSSAQVEKSFTDERSLQSAADREGHGRSLSSHNGLLMPQGGSRGAIYVPLTLPARGVPT